MAKGIYAPDGSMRVTVVDGSGANVSSPAVATNTSSDAVSATSSLPAEISAARGYVSNGSTWDRLRCANAVTRRLSPPAGNSATLVKASPGWVFHINGYNIAAALRYLKLYNKDSLPTVGTDTPFLTLALAPSSAFKFDFPSTNGLYFSTGIGYGMVTGVLDGDNTSITAGDILALNIVYA